MSDIRAMFLRQSMKDCESAFQEAVESTNVLTWDWLVVTAANEAQARAYQEQIEQRLSMGQLPKQTKYLAISDPGGKRVGSGGSTLHVMREISKRLHGAPFASQRILVLHSGGDSQRIPQYSACGKLFAKLPRALSNGRVSTLFDEFCISLSCLPHRMPNGGMLLMSGDVLLLFNALQIDLERIEAACFSIKAPVQTGTRHGVFVSDDHGGVKLFLHKMEESALRAQGAVNAQDQVDIDTGAVWLDAAHVEALHSLVRRDADAERFINESVRLSLYGDFVYPLASGSTLDHYLQQAPENEHSPALEACRRSIWETIGGTRLSLVRLSPAEFIHFGTTEEWRSLMITGEERFHFLNWQRMIQSVGPDHGGFAAVNSILSQAATIGEGSVLEDCVIGPGAVIGKGCVVSGAVFNGTLPDNTVLHVLPIMEGAAYCARVYGVLDNPKETKWLGRPIDEPLWSASLHPVGQSMEEAVKRAMFKTDDQKISLREGFARSSMKDVLAWQQKLSDDIRAERIVSALQKNTPAAEVAQWLTQDSGMSNLSAPLLSKAEDSKFPMKHRLYYVLARAAGSRSAAEAMDAACWGAIHQHMIAAIQENWQANSAIAKECAKVSLPVRVNWGGGWSDTPPYCLEHGGTVLNASVLLNGKKPVTATARRMDRPVIHIQSDDLGVSREYTQIEELATGNPYDPHALCKAALTVCGVIPRGGKGPVAPLLDKMGGISITTSVANVPVGSGLGTSSILCAATIRALLRLFGMDDGDARVAWLTLCMEQLMNTGGGWQDQVGGLVPGIKLISSLPGTPQNVKWRNISMPSEAARSLSDRHVLVFTGQRRLARNLLREIMGKAVANHPETMRLLKEIQKLAVLMAFELEMGSVDRFALLLREHWALSKRLDGGSSNTCIDHLVSVCEDYVDGMMICGAGGGGFMSMVLKNGVTPENLQQTLASVYQESGVRVWESSLDGMDASF